MSCDVERLAEWFEENLTYDSFRQMSNEDFATLFASGWLAAHDAEVAARVLREAADAIEEEPVRARDLTSSFKRAYADFLRARADRVAGQDYTSNSIPEPPPTPDPGKNPTKPRTF